MNRKEAKKQRAAIAKKERQLVQHHCKTCPNSNLDTTACNGCSIFSQINTLGQEFDAVTKTYRKANNIKVYDESLIEPEAPKKYASRERWRKYQDLATENGVSRSLFNIRVNNGMEPYDAATYPVRQRLLTDEQIDAANKNGIAYHTLVFRIKRGWSYEDAINTPTDKKRG